LETGRLAIPEFYRLDRIVLRTARAALTLGLGAAYLIWRVNMTYRYDNRREGIVGKNPSREAGHGNSRLETTGGDTWRLAPRTPVLDNRRIEVQEQSDERRRARGRGNSGDDRDAAPQAIRPEAETAAAVRGDGLQR
jgi:hypothetical protein